MFKAIIKVTSIQFPRRNDHKDLTTTLACLLLFSATMPEIIVFPLGFWWFLHIMWHVEVIMTFVGTIVLFLLAVFVLVGWLFGVE